MALVNKFTRASTTRFNRKKKAERAEEEMNLEESAALDAIDASLKQARELEEQKLLRAYQEVQAEKQRVEDEILAVRRRVEEEIRQDEEAEERAEEEGKRQNAEKFAEEAKARERAEAVRQMAFAPGPHGARMRRQVQEFGVANPSRARENVKRVAAEHAWTKKKYVPPAGCGTSAKNWLREQIKPILIRPADPPRRKLELTDLQLERFYDGEKLLVLRSKNIRDADEGRELKRRGSGDFASLKTKNPFVAAEAEGDALASLKTKNPFLVASQKKPPHSTYNSEFGMKIRQLEDELVEKEREEQERARLQVEKRRRFSVLERQRQEEEAERTRRERERLELLFGVQDDYPDEKVSDVRKKHEPLGIEKAWSPRTVEYAKHRIGMLQKQEDVRRNPALQEAYKVRTRKDCEEGKFDEEKRRKTAANYRMEWEKHPVFGSVEENDYERFRKKLAFSSYPEEMERRTGRIIEKESAAAEDNVANAPEKIGLVLALTREEERAILVEEDPAGPYWFEREVSAPLRQAYERALTAPPTQVRRSNLRGATPTALRSDSQYLRASERARVARKLEADHLNDEAAFRSQMKEILEKARRDRVVHEDLPQRYREIGVSEDDIEFFVRHAYNFRSGEELQVNVRFPRHTGKNAESLALQRFMRDKRERALAQASDGSISAADFPGSRGYHQGCGETTGKVLPPVKTCDTAMKSILAERGMTGGGVFRNRGRFFELFREVELELETAGREDQAGKVAARKKSYEISREIYLRLAKLRKAELELDEAREAEFEAEMEKKLMVIQSDSSEEYLEEPVPEGEVDGSAEKRVASVWKNAVVEEQDGRFDGAGSGHVAGAVTAGGVVEGDADEIFASLVARARDEPEPAEFGGVETERDDPSEDVAGRGLYPEAAEDHDPEVKADAQGQVDATERHEFPAQEGGEAAVARSARAFAAQSARAQAIRAQKEAQAEKRRQLFSKRINTRKWFDEKMNDGTLLTDAKTVADVFWEWSERDVANEQLFFTATPFDVDWGSFVRASGGDAKRENDENFRERHAAYFLRVEDHAQRKAYDKQVAEFRELEKARKLEWKEKGDAMDRRTKRLLEREMEEEAARLDEMKRGLREILDFPGVPFWLLEGYEAGRKKVVKKFKAAEAEEGGEGGAQEVSEPMAAGADAGGAQEESEPMVAGADASEQKADEEAYEGEGPQKMASAAPKSAPAPEPPPKLPTSRFKAAVKQVVHDNYRQKQVARAEREVTHLAPMQVEQATGLSTADGVDPPLDSDDPAISAWKTTYLSLRNRLEEGGDLVEQLNAWARTIPMTNEDASLPPEQEQPQNVFRQNGFRTPESFLFEHFAKHQLNAAKTIRKLTPSTYQTHGTVNSIMGYRGKERMDCISLESEERIARLERLALRLERKFGPYGTSRSPIRGPDHGGGGDRSSTSSRRPSSAAPGAVGGASPAGGGARAGGGSDPSGERTDAAPQKASAEQTPTFLTDEAAAGRSSQGGHAGRAPPGAEPTTTKANENSADAEDKTTNPREIDRLIRYALRRKDLFRK